MQLENLATAVEVDSPHRRYAALHRAIDNGMASDATWRELVDVCLVLNHQDEALRAFRRLSSPQSHRDVEALLVHRGLIKPSEMGSAMPTATPKPGLREELVDAARILVEDHMPLTTAVATLTFPLVVGLGGFLTSGHSFFLFPLIAALPALCVVGIVGALSRGIMVDAANGIHDVPRIPGSAALVRQSARFLLDSLVLVGLIAGPAVAMGFLGLATSTTLLAAAVAAVLLPMAMLMRQITDDWRALSPNYLFRAIGRLGRDYLGRAAVCAGLFLPAALAAVATIGSHLYLQVSVVGPLVVAPLFFAARLLGRLVDLRREDLVDLLDLPPRKRSSIVNAGTTPATPVRATPKPDALRQAPSTKPAAPAAAAPVAPTGVHAAAHNAVRRAAAPQRPAPDPQRPGAAERRFQTAPQRPAAKPGPASPSPLAGRLGVSKPTAPNAPAAAAAQRPSVGARPAPAAPPAKPAPAKPAPAKTPAPAKPAPTEPPATRIEVTEDALPDFTTLSGYHVLQGKARILAGAASTAASSRHRAQP